jgi:hypothetical protein
VDDIGNRGIALLSGKERLSTSTAGPVARDVLPARELACESFTSSHLAPAAHWFNLTSISHCCRRVPKDCDSGRIVPRLRGCLPRPEELPDDSHCGIYVQRCTIFASRHLNNASAYPLTG